jgi:hypothetical protein
MFSPGAALLAALQLAVWLVRAILQP